MGEIIPLRSGQRRRVPVEQQQGSAQILFFLGVRYCREDEDSYRRTTVRAEATRSRQK
jgi:hypothetical protein